jgi:hypothetical protein
VTVRLIVRTLYLRISYWEEILPYPSITAYCTRINGTELPIGLNYRYEVIKLLESITQ